MIVKTETGISVFPNNATLKGEAEDKQEVLSADTVH